MYGMSSSTRAYASYTTSSDGRERTTSAAHASVSDSFTNETSTPPTRVHVAGSMRSVSIRWRRQCRTCADHHQRRTRRRSARAQLAMAGAADAPRARRSARKSPRADIWRRRAASARGRARWARSTGPAPSGRWATALATTRAASPVAPRQRPPTPADAARRSAKRARAVSTTRTRGTRAVGAGEGATSRRAGGMRTPSATCATSDTPPASTPRVNGTPCR